MKGRKPKPTLVKAMQGNPGKRPMNYLEPKPPKGKPKPPDDLSPLAKAEWDRCVDRLASMGLATVADEAAIEAYCEIYATWKEAKAKVRSSGLVVKSEKTGRPMRNPYLEIERHSHNDMLRYLTEFGLTPSSRSRIKVADGGPKDDLELFLKGA